MVTHMKTTIEIATPLLEEAKRTARIQGTTLRELVEQGLRHALSTRKRLTPFKLRKASFKGKGLQAGVKGLSWERLRELAYEGRGT